MAERHKSMVWSNFSTLMVGTMVGMSFTGTIGVQAITILTSVVGSSAVFALV